MKRLDTSESRTIDYSADVASLERYYENRFDLIKKGNTDLVTLELVMLGKALDFIHFAGSKLGITLDTNEASVEKLEEVIDALGRGVLQDNLFSGESGDIAGNMSGYLGVLVIANIGGEWTDTENGAAVNVNDRLAYVCDYIEKRLLGMSELDVMSYFKSVGIVR